MLHLIRVQVSAPWHWQRQFSGDKWWEREANILILHEFNLPKLQNILSLKSGIQKTAIKRWPLHTLLKVCTNALWVGNGLASSPAGGLLVEDGSQLQQIRPQTVGLAY